jgi:hypothetical protein
MRHLAFQQAQQLAQSRIREGQSQFPILDQSFHVQCLYSYYDMVQRDWYNYPVPLNVRKTEYVLLDADRQVHVGMDRAIQLKCSGRVEWADGRIIVACIRLINSGRAAFHVWFRNAVVPRAIGDDVR